MSYEVSSKLEPEEQAVIQLGGRACRGTRRVPAPGIVTASARASLWQVLGRTEQRSDWGRSLRCEEKLLRKSLREKNT